MGSPGSACFFPPLAHAPLLWECCFTLSCCRLAARCSRAYLYIGLRGGSRSLLSRVVFEPHLVGVVLPPSFVLSSLLPPSSPWMGPPTILGVECLHESGNNNFGEMARGTVVI